jgi:hypothetical protein
MKASGFGRHALGVGLAVALLVACGGSQTGMSGTMPQNPLAQSRAHQASGSSGDLVYAITANGIVVLSYPTWSIVARIRAYRNWYAVCSDPNNGNVFAITGNNEIDEYEHGGTTPIATIILPSGYPTACSVDPTTGNLAVAAIDTPTELQDALFIYPQAQGNPTMYSDKLLPGIISPAYDDAGNLFFSASNKARGLRIGELKVGRNQFTIIKLAGNPEGYLQQIQWDGTHLVFLVPNGRGDGTTVNQVAISGKTATIVNSFSLNYCQDAYFWIDSESSSLLSFYYPPKVNNNYAIARWGYPLGGRPTSRFYRLTKGRDDYTYDLTVSVAPSQSRVGK